MKKIYEKQEGFRECIFYAIICANEHWGKDFKDMERKKIKAALLGLGTVGGGVYKLIQRRKDEMEQIIGTQLEIVKIMVHNLDKKREGIDSSLLTDNWQEIIEDEEIEIVIEVIGGIEPAKTMILEALRAGKHVVTANKDLIAQQGRELLNAAEESGADFLFEASVAGGIPIIRPLKQCLAANELTDVVGIVNGTTNYILTKMFEENVSFESALVKAKELGYAEADPTADIEGLDAGRKVAIMASIAFHTRVVFEDVHTEGITKITEKDVAYAKDLDCVIKLLGVAHDTEEGIEVGVYPMILKKEHPLASVRDSFNAVFVHGDAVDDAMFYGRGAGEFPTASAVVGDVIDVARDIQYGCTGRISCTCYKDTPIKKFKEVKNKFFLRMQVKNQPGVLACIAQIFGNHKVSIVRVVQKYVEESQAELVIVTDKVKEGYMKNALKELEDLDDIYEVSSVIRAYL